AAAGHMLEADGRLQVADADVPDNGDLGDFQPQVRWHRDVDDAAGGGDGIDHRRRAGAGGGADGGGGRRDGLRGRVGVEEVVLAPEVDDLGDGAVDLEASAAEAHAVVDAANAVVAELDVLAHVVEDGVHLRAATDVDAVSLVLGLGDQAVVPLDP